MKNKLTIIYIFLITTFVINAKQPIKNLNNINSWSKSIIDTLNIINAKSYYPIKFDNCVIKALDAFVHQDEYSRFLNPEEYKKLIGKTTAQFYGIGVKLAPKNKNDDTLSILEVVPGGPAEKSGLKKFDKIFSIEKEPVKNLSTEEVINKIKTEKQYSPLNMDIIRDSKEILNFNIKRDTVKEENVTSYLINNQKILYCSILLFTEKVANHLEKILHKANQRKVKGIILDLRDNGGGILKSAVNCASLFLKNNQLVVFTKDRNQIIKNKLYTNKDQIIKNKIPIIILVNGFTASAAEILAGALKINSKKNSNNPYIFLLGTKTFGKGSVQELIPMPNNCALKLTTSLYYLPDSRSIDKIGLEPDFYVEQKYPSKSEIKLLNQIANKKDEENRLKSEKTPLDENLKIIKSDHQLLSAIQLITLLNFAKNNFDNKISSHEKALKFLKDHHISSDQLNIEKLK